MDERDAVILVVEDDPDHRLLIEMVFKRNRPRTHVHVVTRAEAAIAYLDGPWAGTDLGSSAFPDVILLDVRMPGIGGMGFLEWYADQKGPVREIPVVILTSSESPELASRCFALGAREFKEKPADFGELVGLVDRLTDRWRGGWRAGGDSA